MVSGGFDPIHKGHVDYILHASKMCDVLIVVVNGDSFLKRKKGYAFMSLEERCYICRNIKGVDYVYGFESNSDTVDEAIKDIHPDIFFKGGDRTGPENIPEWAICQMLSIDLVIGVGGGKTQSSSDLVLKQRTHVVTGDEGEHGQRCA